MAVQSVPAAPSHDIITHSRKRREAIGTDGREIVTIFNVSGEEFYEPRTYGNYMIPACKPGERYAWLVVDKTTEVYDIGNKKKGEVDITGGTIARDIITGHMEFGVGIAAGVEPTEAELRQAEMQRDRHYRQLVEDADTEYASSGKPRMVLDVAKRAALALGISPNTKPWIFDQELQKFCPNCDERVRPNAKVCKHCGRDIVEGPEAIAQEAEPVAEVPKSKRARSRSSE
jgi:hypothetical protein